MSLQMETVTIWPVVEILYTRGVVNISSDCEDFPDILATKERGHNCHWLDRSSNKGREKREN